MQLLAPILQDRIVRDLLRERVLEDIFDVRDRRLLIDELAKLEIGEQTFELVLRSSSDGSRQAEYELSSEHRECLQEGLLIGAQPVDAGGEDGLHGRRDAQG